MTTIANNPAGWRTDRPAAPGWFNASADLDADIRRHWNGSRWSAPVYHDDPQTHFERAQPRAADRSVGAIHWRAAA